ncbi:hypothetical protein GCM10027447_27900 [Glycomyces halotolerans]
MHDYTVTFIEPVDLRRLAQAVSAAFVIPIEQIEIWDGSDFATPVTEPVIAQVAPGSGPGAYAEFVGFDAFAEHTGNPDRLAVAIELVEQIKKRAVLAPEAAEDFLWTLVTADGSHGSIVVDSDKLDDGVIEIVGAAEHIQGAPELPVIGLGSYET